MNQDRTKDYLDIKRPSLGGLSVSDPMTSLVLIEIRVEGRWFVFREFPSTGLDDARRQATNLVLHGNRVRVRTIIVPASNVLG